jgi:hypothetical protein
MKPVVNPYLIGKKRPTTIVPVTETEEDKDGDNSFKKIRIAHNAVSVAAPSEISQLEILVNDRNSVHAGNGSDNSMGGSICFVPQPTIVRAVANEPAAAVSTFADGTVPGKSIPVTCIDSIIGGDSGDKEVSSIVQSVTRRTTRENTSDQLGHLRVREGINFAWTGSRIAEENNEIGRVYFRGFSLCNKKFKTGDIVTIETAEVNETVCRIVSTFQATKSFIGHYQYYEGLVEIQKRGEFALSMLLWCFDWGLL